MRNILPAVASIVTPVPDRAQGPDLSHWDGGFDPTKASKRIDFIFFKLTEGTGFIDEKVDEIWEGVKQIAVRGGYHYQRSGFSWTQQADHFLKVAGRFDLHAHALDLEEINNTYNDSFFSDTRRIIERWREKAPTKKILLYTNASTYNRLYYAFKRFYPSDYLPFLEGLDFWYAWPSKIFNEPILPITRRNTWRFWQKAWDGKPEEWGTEAAADVNVFNGTREQLAQWAGITSLPPVEPPVVEPPAPPPVIEPVVEPTVFTAEVLVQSIVVRTYPLVNDTTKTDLRVRYQETFKGKIWPGNDYLWIQVTESARSALIGKWVAVRKIDGAERLIMLRVWKPPAISGDVYRLYKWGDEILVREAGRTVANFPAGQSASNFQAIGLYNKTAGAFGGVSYFLRISQSDVRKLAAMQVEDEYKDKQPGFNKALGMEAWRVQKMNWLAKDKGTIYFWFHHLNGDSYQWHNVDYLEWGTVELGHNFVTVEDIETFAVTTPSGQRGTRKMARLAGFRRTDWGRPLAELVARGLVQRCYCVYSGDDLGDSPKGIVYSPFWSPRDWTFISSTKQQPDAFYLPFDWMYKP